MNYQETVHWMFHQLPMYQLQGASAYKKDLTNTLLLADYLGHPEEKLRCIHVAGTNGKGSTSHFLASVFQEAGYKVGLYTSPHLKDFRERIKINGEPISEAFVTDFIGKHRSFFEQHDMSFFEMSVGLAFDYFREAQIDIAIIEVGMGGRLDSTNIITPLLSVITNIGFDHTQFLGNTLSAIAAEKAGIIKQNIPVVVGEYTSETQPVFIRTAAEKHAKIYFASDLILDTYPSPLEGNYQLKNKKTVLQALRVMQNTTDFVIPEEAIQTGFWNVIQNTGLQGRWQQLGQTPTVICDTAHNKEGLLLVLEQVLSQEFEHLHIVLGMVNDKDLTQILPLFPKNAHYYFCKPNIPRGLEASLLQNEAAQFGLIGTVYASVSDAYKVALRLARAADFIFIGGSTFVVAEIL